MIFKLIHAILSFMHAGLHWKNEDCVQCADHVSLHACDCPESRRGGARQRVPLGADPALLDEPGLSTRSPSDQMGMLGYLSSPSTVLHDITMFSTFHKLVAHYSCKAMEIVSSL